MASSSGSSKFCFNSTCKQLLDVPKQGWLCRTGNYADLCDRCSSSYKDGKFCETYHSNASGWRCCESCGKKIHCGCIVSFHMFILLDAGGIECLNCAKTEYILTPNPTWPSTLNLHNGPADRIRDISSKNWRSIAGSGPVPWRQAPSLFNVSKSQPELQPISLSLGNKSPTDNLSRRLLNDNWRVGTSNMIGGYRASVSGVPYDGQHNLLKDVSCQSFFHNNYNTPLSSLPATCVSNDLKLSGVHVQQPCPPPLSVGRQCLDNNGAGPSLEIQAHNAKSRVETLARTQPLPLYSPRITDQDLQQIYGCSNTKITPLFEKVLSASDAGKIGRLVLPKKCAEAYLPPLSQPEGYPLVIQDLKGKDWVLQYRYWPNNNSKMYVLEGVNPCIQSMQLQAGDTVTFSRLEPEGKLVIGSKKTSIASASDKGNETTNTNVSAQEEPLNNSIASKSKSAVDTISNPAKRKKGGNMCLNNKQLNNNKEEIYQLNVTLEQVQELLRPRLTNVPSIVLIEGVEFEVYQDAPTIGSPTITTSTNDVGSCCSMEIEPTQEHLPHRLPMINHAASSKQNSSENPESTKTNENIAPLMKLAASHHKPGCSCIVCIQPQSSTMHHPACTCNVCLMMKHHDQKHSTNEVGNLLQSPSPYLYADIIRYTQMEISNQKSENFGNDLNKEKPPPVSSFKIDLNIQPEREEECFPVSDSMGIMRLVEESTQRYIRQQQKLINGSTIKDANH
ncbi:B3 domain-containing protein Os07g0563300 isoform X2 [Rutidosis leptorrhynchoides]|uniref:B3 domain-containing protein Os07g0563300 isoform X2 n=1 Tax=Rutidosis leptorrhynchoides TaxID=125765 RepID=UPI003A99F5FA